MCVMVHVWRSEENVVDSSLLLPFRGSWRGNAAHKTSRFFICRNILLAPRFASIWLHWSWYYLFLSFLLVSAERSHPWRTFLTWLPPSDVILKLLICFLFYIFMYGPSPFREMCPMWPSELPVQCSPGTPQWVAVFERMMNELPSDRSIVMSGAPISSGLFSIHMG